MATFSTKKRLKELNKAHDLLTPHIWAAKRGGHAYLEHRLREARSIIADALDIVRTTTRRGGAYD